MKRDVHVTLPPTSLPLSPSFTGYDQSVVCKGGWSKVLQDSSTIVLFLIVILEEDCQVRPSCTVLNFNSHHYLSAVL